MATGAVIELTHDDIFEDFETIIQDTTLFQSDSNVDTLNIFIFYVDKKEIINFKKYEVSIKDNKLKKRELMTIILNNNKYHSKKFDLIGIYKYGFHLNNSHQLKDFCSNPEAFNFVKSYRKLQEIPFELTLEAFKQHNYVMLFFSLKEDTPVVSSETSTENKSKTDTTTSFSSNTNGKTKKNVRFDLGRHNKTLRKGV